MELTIITPTQQLVFTITWLELNTPSGNFVIQPERAATILTLSPQQKFTFCLENGKRESMLVRQGVAHITRNSATIVINE
jgi:F0F1-type ATP synthase epsilon subunit